MLVILSKTVKTAREKMESREYDRKELKYNERKGQRDGEGERES